MRGPLTLLHDPVAKPEPPVNLIDYINAFRHQLYAAGELAMEKLASAQVKMKRLYDRKAEQHQFSPSDHVLALLPIVTSPFQAKFTGPFTVLRQISEQNYLSLPKCRKSTQLCHVNLLKHYFENVPPVSDSSGKEQDRSVRSVSVAATVGTIYSMTRETGVRIPVGDTNTNPVWTLRQGPYS